MQFLERYWYLVLGAALGPLALWIVVLRPRNEGEPTRLSTSLIFGPFGPAVDRYLVKHGGITKREWIGWGIVLLVGILAIVFTPSRGT